MATWIVFLHLLMPSIPTLATTAPVAGAVVDSSAAAELGPRYPGVERLFAKFDREAQKR
ncbi:MAG: hypothetical protein KC486_19685 [Myxococcales bacterium]|nr:hypothetical protein [Myxococcales bacterium]